MNSAKEDIMQGRNKLLKRLSPPPNGDLQLLPIGVWSAKSLHLSWLGIFFANISSKKITTYVQPDKKICTTTI
jgi:hypothetical protein